MLLGDNDYSGMASWTGTMFEYFMPNLLLPCEPNSFLFETLAFCVYAQRRRGARTKTPWGISESGFYAFDPGMRYQYKAHGVQTLALKRGLDAELVVAPYASFLALLLSPRRALRNLRRLRDMGLEGRYGLYEAVDYTPARLPGGEPCEVVRSYMSHHLGMSLVAIDNTLRENVMQRRFMADSDMGAYRELLQERVPVGEPVMRREERDIPERKPRPGSGSALARAGEGCARLCPECHLISNGDYAVLAHDSGVSAARMGEEQITLARPGEPYAPAGVSVFFHGPDGLRGLTPAPLYQREGDYRWEFYSAGAAWSARWGELSARTTVAVPRRENGELRRVELTWSGKEPLEGELLIYLEPALCPLRDFAAHPAFSRLFLEGKRLGDGVVFRRRPRGHEETKCLAAVWEGERASACLDRSAALGRGGLRALPGRSPGPMPEGIGTDPCLMVRVPVRLGPGERTVFPLALAVGDGPAAAAEGARRILAGRGGEPGSLSPLAHRLGLSEREALDAFDLLARLEAVEQAGTKPPQSALWPFGISGDLPIAAGPVSAPEEGERAAVWCRWHQLLTRSGYPFDLVVLLEESGDYRRPLRSALLEALRAMGAESALGAKGGVHLVDSAAAPAVLAWAKAALPLAEKPAARQPAPVLEPVALAPEPAPWTDNGDGSVTIQTGERLPLVGWAQILCNPNFGWLADETGAGFLWAGGNAREGRLSPWANDPLAVGGAERITVTVHGEERSVFADGDGLPCAVTYGPGFARWEKELGGVKLDTQGFVPQNEDCRVLNFTLSGGAGLLSCRLGESEPVSRPLAGGVPAVLVTAAGEGGPVCRFVSRPVEEPLRETLGFWRKAAAPIAFSTPSPALDRFLNGWCLYQVIACRLLARTSQYQNGGAFGFRDQLQDSMALLLTWPERTREQLILCASRQFEEGDVQHWWHPPHGAGVRTRITDDLLFLPWALARYCRATADWSVLEERTPWLKSRPLEPGEMERYETPQTSERSDTLYRHALAAVRCALRRGSGPHGLALMGGGDWNDGMNRVGAKGRGESVWLTWFLTLVLQEFAPVCRRAGEEETARELLKAADRYLAAAQNAWDGAWYLRGRYDDGTPLGSRESGQCQIDSIAQSFSALPLGADRERANAAVDAALERLFDRTRGVVRLFDPAFDDRGGKDPGYIKGYPAGARENGGQYTHGALWLALACFRLDRPRDGWDLLDAILPENHTLRTYRAEPYVLAADVSYSPGREGQAGWSWYTGAAGWFWQVAVGELLGLTREDGKLRVRPNLPPEWPGYRAGWRGENWELEIKVERTGDPSCALDGKPADGADLNGLRGKHVLRVTF